VYEAAVPSSDTIFMPFSKQVCKLMSIKEGLKLLKHLLSVVGVTCRD